MDIAELPLERLIPYARNPRKSDSAVATVAASLKEFGWRQPIVVDEAMVILAGHTRLEAARQLGLTSAPVHVARGLTPAQAKAYRLMDNRGSENAEWDEALLGPELGDLQGEGFDLGPTGFDDDELNRLLAGLGDEADARDGEDDIPETPLDPISRPGDLWQLGPHRLLCGGSTVATDVEGDPVNLAKKRTVTFWNRKIVLVSTPTIRGLSRIETAYAESDQRQYWVPCPICGTQQVLVWGQVRWDSAAGEHRPETARYHCSGCDAA